MKGLYTMMLEKLRQEVFESLLELPKNRLGDDA